MRLLWLDINASYAHSSLALPAIHSQLKEDLLENVEWKVLSGTINSDPYQLIIDMESYNADVVLSTVWLFNHTFLIDILRKFKTLCPNTIIFLGGPQFLGNNNSFLEKNRFVDAAFRGEGEEMFPKILDALIKKNDWKSFPGVCSIDKNGYYRDNGKVTVTDFAKLSPPERSAFFNWDRAFVQIETSRGCFNRCSFCISGEECKIQNILPSEIEHRISFIKTKGIKEIRILDRTFNANSARALELLDIFSKFSGQIRFHLEIHPAFINDAFKEKLKTVPSGTLHLEAGLQSLDDTVLSACKRAGGSQRSIEGVKMILSLNKFELHVDLIAGLPHYYFDNMLEDIKTLIKINPDEIQLELLKLLPGTKLRENANLYGIIYSSEPPYEVLETHSISYKGLYKATILSKILDIWYNNNVWRNPFRTAVIENQNFITSLIDFVINGHLLDNPLSLESKGILIYEFCQLHFKDYTIDFCAAWIEAGLSLKKGPGKCAVQWVRKNSEKKNPIFDENEPYFSFYYLEDNRKELWYAFDKRNKKEKPLKCCKISIS